jgi:hypothetical protein
MLGRGWRNQPASIWTDLALTGYFPECHSFFADLVFSDMENSPDNSRVGGQCDNEVLNQLVLD